jgi:type 1 glutamine amidotransferase
MMWKKLVCLTLGLVVACLTLSPAGGGEGKGKIGVVIIDGQNNHDWRSTTPFLKKVLQKSGRFRVDVSTGPLSQEDKKKKRGLPKGWEAVPFPPDLSKYDVVLSNYNGDSWPKDFQKDLDENLKSGKIDLVIVHAANNSFGGWKEYNLMIGMGWRGNSFGDRLTYDENGKEVRVPKGKGPGAGHGAQHAFQVVIRDPNHPITKGMPKEWMHAQDELYHGMRGPAEHVHLLATAFDDKSKGGTGENEPMIWTVTYGKGRVFHTPMGHDLNGMRCIGFITTLLRGTEWAATGKVTVPIPSNFPEHDKTSSIGIK